MKKISLGIITFMFLLTIAAPLTGVQAFTVLPGNSGHESSAWHFRSWGYRGSTAFTEYSQVHASSNAFVSVVGRSNQAINGPGRMAIATLTAGVNEARTHATW